MITDYFNIILAISVGFIGTFMLLSQSINKSVSDLDKCDNYTIVAKQYREGGFRRAELNIIKVDIDGEIYSLLCKHQYWTTLSIGQTVDICIYKSHIGFDYIELKEDK